MERAGYTPLNSSGLKVAPAALVSSLRDKGPVRRMKRVDPFYLYPRIVSKEIVNLVCGENLEAMRPSASSAHIQCI